MKKPAYMKQLLCLVLLLGIGFPSMFASQAVAQEKAMSMEDAAAVMKNFDPTIKVMSVDPAPINGLTEVVVTVKGEVGIVYISADKKHVILGSIVDAETKDNITKAKFELVKSKYEPKVDFAAIALEDAVVMGDPKAKIKVVVFDDPD